MVTANATANRSDLIIEIYLDTELRHLSTRFFEITLTAISNTALPHRQRDEASQQNHLSRCPPSLPPKNFKKTNRAPQIPPIECRVARLRGQSHTFTYYSLFPTSPLSCNLLIAFQTLFGAPAVEFFCNPTPSLLPRTPPPSQKTLRIQKYVNMWD